MKKAVVQTRVLNRLKFKIKKNKYKMKIIRKLNHNPKNHPEIVISLAVIPQLQRRVMKIARIYFSHSKIKTNSNNKTLII